MVLDDLGDAPPRATNGARWQLFTDRVMGGVSRGTMNREIVAGRPAIRMRGDVRLENSGGFVQIALDLAPDGGPLDISGFAGLEMDVCGNGEIYGVHLRTDDVSLPWQSYRHSFAAAGRWHTVRLAFSAFAPHRLDAPLDLRHVRRIGLVAIGRAFTADLSLGRLALYREV